MMRLVKFPDETINDIPEADIVPNAALTYLQQNPTAYRRLCTNHSVGHAIDACIFVHLRNAVRQPAPPPAPPAAQVTRRVMFPDETVKDIPEADIVPNAALTYLQQYPTAYRRLCTNHSAGHAIDPCNFVHLRNAVRQPAPPPAPPGPASLFIGVVVDGFCFTKRFGWDTEAFTQLINDITRWISQAANAAALVHKDAKVFLYPNSTDARRKQLISDAQLSSTMSALDRLRDAGWRVIHTNFKLVGELWKATAEDVAFSNECASLCCTGALAPLGASPARITLHHVVIVTGDNDHVSTFGTQSNNELRWLVDINPSPDPNQPLRRAAREAQRLIPCTAVPECDPRFMPSVTDDIEALREQLAQEAVGPPLVDRV